MLHLTLHPEYVKAVQEDRLREAQKARQRRWLAKRPLHDPNRQRKRLAPRVPVRRLAGNR